MKNIKTYEDMLNEESDQERLNRELWGAAMYGSAAAVEEVLDRGAEINSADLLGMTALHWAALNRKATMIKMLLHRGADPNLEDMKGSTPLRTMLRYVRTHDLIDLAKFFIGYGADPLKAFDGPREVIDWFNGDLSWMPGGLGEKIKRMHRGKSAFGM